LRLGVQEMTRFGMRESEMLDIAMFIKKVLIDKKEPRVVANEVSEFRRSYTKVMYTFPDDVVNDALRLLE